MTKLEKHHIGDHYWVIHGYGGTPSVEEQKAIAELEIQDYKNKQEYAKEKWSGEEWADQQKLYEYSLYGNMIYFWENIVDLANGEPDDNSPPDLEEVEIKTEGLEETDIKLGLANVEPLIFVCDGSDVDDPCVLNG